jgi:hypothetical protein
MRDDQLPTPAQMLASARADLDTAFAALREAYRAFGDASDMLRSDWPDGYELTDQQVADRDTMHKVIVTGKRLINEIKNVGGR